MICEIIDNVAGKALRCLIGSFMSFSWWLSGYLPWSVPVETAEQALAIGERVAHEEFPNVDYSRYKVRVNFHSLRNGYQEWCVWYELVDENGEHYPYLFGGNGPEIHIRPTDGKILRISRVR